MVSVNGTILVDDYSDLTLTDSVQATIHEGGQISIGRAGGLLVRDFSELDILSGGQVEIDQDGQSSIDEGSSVFIRSGARLELTENATMTIQDKGYLRVQENGNLRVRKGAQIIVEAGGTLEIDAGALIDLWWHESTVHIREGGTLIYNGAFVFDGFGFFQFDAGHQFVQNDKLVLVGQKDRFIRLNERAILEVNDYGLDLSNGAVEYQAGAFIRTAQDAEVTIQDMVFSGYGDNAIGNTALRLQDATNVLIRQSTFQNLERGIVASGTNTPTELRIYDTTFKNCSEGLTTDGCPKVFVQESTFEKTNRGVLAVRMSNATDGLLSGCRITGYNPKSSLGAAVHLWNIESMYINGSQITGNTQGVLLKDVPALRVFGGSISNNSVAGITVPDIGTGNNVSNIFLFSQASISDNAVGIDFGQGGGIDADGTYYGLVLMDCAELYNNGVGIRGDDVLLQIDAFINAGTVNPLLIRPNKIHGSGVYFDICYRTFSSLIGVNIPARGNYWGGITNSADLNDQIKVRKSLGGNFCTNSGNILDLGLLVPVEPVGCNGDSDPIEPNDPNDDTGGPVVITLPQDSLIGTGPSCLLSGVDAPRQVQDIHYKGYSYFRAGMMTEARQEFTQTASVSSFEQASTTSMCKHYINVAKVMANGDAPNYRFAESANEIVSPELTVFPNPVRSECSILYPAPDFSVKVYDAMGSLIFTDRNSYRMDINVEQWTSGIYFIELRDEVSKQIKREKIVVGQ